MQCEQIDNVVEDFSMVFGRGNSAQCGRRATRKITTNKDMLQTFADIVQEAGLIAL